MPYSKPQALIFLDIVVILVKKMFCETQWEQGLFSRSSLVKKILVNQPANYRRIYIYSLCLLFKEKLSEFSDYRSLKNKTSQAGYISW